jgi:hypothetical protein
MAFRKILKSALPLWLALVFLGAFLLETSNVVQTAGWHEALKRFALIVVTAYPVSVAIIYRFTIGARWYRTP